MMLPRLISPLAPTGCDALGGAGRLAQACGNSPRPRLAAPPARAAGTPHRGLVLRRRDEPPTWLISLLHEIDTLQFGPEFERFCPDADLMFGAMHAKGVTAIKRLFISLTRALATQHRVHEFWAGRHTNLFRGDVAMFKRDATSQTIVVPTAQFFVMSGRGLDRIETLRVVVGPLGFDMS